MGWDGLRNRQIDVCTSELSFLEVAVKPLRLQDDMLYGLFQRILYDVIGFATLPISLTILARAAQLRASTSLKTPDAIHAATALEAGCTLFVTNDAAFKRVPDLTVAVLSDLTD